MLDIFARPALIKLWKKLMKIETRITKTLQLPIESLTPFQGAAKKLSDENRNKLRKVLIEEGFSFTVHVWEHSGKTFILDGHQRVEVMRGLKKEGYTIPNINCAYVSAKTFKQAKKLVLMAISQYGKIDKEGFYDFLGDDEFDFGDFDFPDFEMAEMDFDSEENVYDPKDDEFLLTRLMGFHINQICLRNLKYLKMMIHF